MVSTHLLNNGRDEGVMYVRDLGEEVMLNLEVEPADIPREERVVCREVRGRLDLMRSPSVGQSLSFGGEIRLHHVSDHVRELKGRREGKAYEHLNRDPAEEDLPPRETQHRDRERHREEEQFEANETGDRPL